MLQSNHTLNRPFPEQVEVIHSLPKHPVFSTKNIKFTLNLEAFGYISEHHNGKVIRETLAYNGYPSIFLSKSMNLKKIIERRKLYNSLQKISTKIGSFSKYEKINSQHQQKFSRYEMIKSVICLRNKQKKRNPKTGSNVMKHKINCLGLSFHFERGKNKPKMNGLPWIPAPIPTRQNPLLSIKKNFNPRNTLPAELSSHISPWTQQEVIE